MVSKDLLMRNLSYTLKSHYFKVINSIIDDFNAIKSLTSKYLDFKVNRVYLYYAIPK
jgi:hypothetical protein